MDKTINEVERKFYENLKELRISKNYTQKDIAIKSGLTQQAVSSIETGSRKPTMTNLIKFLNALGIDINKVFKGTIQIDEEVVRVAFRRHSGNLVIDLGDVLHRKSKNNTKEYYEVIDIKKDRIILSGENGTDKILFSDIEGTPEFYDKGWRKINVQN